MLKNKRNALFRLLTALFVALMIAASLSACDLGGDKGKGSANTSTSETQISGISGEEANDSQSDSAQEALPPYVTLDDGNEVYSQGDFTVNVLTFGQAISEITIGAAIVPQTRYVLEGDILTIAEEYMRTFEAKEDYVFKLTTNGGSDSFVFTVNDVPTIEDKTNFIKYPGEIVRGENFTTLVKNKVGSVNVSYSLKEGNGTLTDNGNGTFDYEPADIFRGEALITVTATDSYGLIAQRDIALIYKTVDPIIEGEPTFNISEEGDLTIAVKKRGNEKGSFQVAFVSVTGNGITENDCAADDSFHNIIISGDYLKSLPLGEYTFTLTSTAGQADFTVKLMAKPAVLSPNGNVVNPGSAITFTLNLNGYSFTGVKAGDSVVADENYALSGNELTFNAQFTEGLAVGETAMTLLTDGGNVTFTIVKNDAPTIREKTDFIKLPGESIENESFKSYVDNLVGALTYTYALSEDSADKGVLTDNGNGKFNFTPSGVYAGTVSIIFTATDEYGLSAQRETSLIYKTVTPKIYDADVKTVDKKDDFEDLVMTVDTFGKENSSLYYQMADITLDGESIGGQNYVLERNGSKRYFALKANYLRSLAVGKYVFTFHTVVGSAEFSVTVNDTRPVQVDVDKVFFTLGVTEGNIVVNVTPYANEVTADSFALGNETFTVGESFTYESGVLTIFNQYLNTLAVGDKTLTINGEAKVTLTIKVPEPVVELPIINLSSEGYYIDAYNDVTFQIELNGNEFVGVYQGETALESEVDYIFDEQTGELKFYAKYNNEAYRFGETQLSLTLKTDLSEDVAFAIPFENAANRVLNGGFETGDLYGWNAYAIWKNESGLKAWTDDRVVDGTYFDQNYQYNRDGNYNIGLYGGSITKNSGQERMGHLRSAPFILGGSGWVSFKMGGGSLGEFAYISVRKTEGNIEIARFSNKNFNDTDLSGTDNAEGYMFRYYYDLSSYIGESLYFVISDTSSHNWCVLSADSFFTYYKNAPAVAESELAENILPTILGVDTATAEIKGGTFDENWRNYWSTDSICFDVKNGYMMSNRNNTGGEKTGDKGVGVLRSSAFTVAEGNAYLYLKWSGGLEFDKQEFISVKEVGTNIEVLRFASGSTSNVNISDGDDKYKDQTLDLTTLAGNGKKYYLEICDNKTESWGCIFVSAFEFRAAAYSRQAKQIIYNDYHPYLPTSEYVLPY